LLDLAAELQAKGRHHQCFSYRAALLFSSKTLNYVSGIIRRHRASIGSAGRSSTTGSRHYSSRPARSKAETFADLEVRFEVGTATQAVHERDSGAARGPHLKRRKAAREAKKARYSYVVLDETLVPIDRVAADRPFYSGKHKGHGMNLQFIASPSGDILWV
jgi:hypothetical protein